MTQDKGQAPTQPDSTEGVVFRTLIKFLLCTDEALVFLRCWNEGNFDACRKEWPEAPSDLYPDTFLFQAAPAAQADSVLEDAARLDWLEQHDGRYCNIDKVASVVGTGFLTESQGNMPQVHSTLRAAIDAARTTKRPKP